MYRKHLKLILRGFARSKIYTAINVAGLIIALTAAFLIYSHVVKEWSTDRFHKNRQLIYRVTDKEANAQNWESYSCAQIGPYTKDQYPEIRDFVRVEWRQKFGIKLSDEMEYRYVHTCIFADKQFFSVFSFPLMSGSQEEDWGRNWVVVSEKIAKQYFGGENPVGRFLKLKSDRGRKEEGEFKVVGIMEDFPSSSTLQADVVADFSEHEKNIYTSWGALGVYTFFLLEDKADVASIEEGIPQIVEKNYSWIKASEKIVELQPLEDIYLGSSHILEKLPHGSARLNVILSVITVLILILAAGNFLMIKTACLNRQMPGIAVQRCMGASAGGLCKQIFLEVGICVAMAFGVAGIFIVWLHPFFVEIISPHNPYRLQLSVDTFLFFLTLLAFFVGVIGTVLASYIFHRISQNNVQGIVRRNPQKFDLKQGLSFVQMCIFCGLLCCSVVLTRQMDFIKARELGFDSRQVVLIEWNVFKQNMETLRSELMHDPDILAVSNGDLLPLMGQELEELALVDEPERVFKSYMVHGDAEFINTYRIKLLEGRNIDKSSYPEDNEQFMDYRPDKQPEILINRKLAEQLSQKDPVGTLLSLGERRKFRVVGVVDDFHFLPLYEAVKPMFIVYDMPFVSNSLLIRYREGKRAGVLAGLEKLYLEKHPGLIFHSYEYDYSQLYDKDIALVKLINIFTCMAVLIGGMGIFAFSMFMAESKKKEVALRKVNGAEEWQIINLLNRNFIVRILLACLIGLPVVHYLMSAWLQGFAYKTMLGIGLYLGVTGVCIVLVLLIVTCQTWRAASMNPVDVLKNE